MPALETKGFLLSLIWLNVSANTRNWNYLVNFASNEDFSVVPTRKFSVQKLGTEYPRKSQFMKIACEMSRKLRHYYEYLQPLQFR
jgi:hypothetical protein